MSFKKINQQPFISTHAFVPKGNGDTGPTGVKGDTGDNSGFTGPTGEKGDKGDKGDNSGFTGPIGPSGRNGINGSIGPAGRNGINGCIGPIGPAGRDGINGCMGPPGRNGINGSIGPAGRDGINGCIGPAGRDGINGCMGPPGRNGVIGPIGPPGPAGPAGPPGRSEVTNHGIVGQNGVDGSINGTPGYIQYINSNGNGLTGSNKITFDTNSSTLSLNSTNICIGTPLSIKYSGIPTILNQIGYTTTTPPYNATGNYLSGIPKILTTLGIPLTAGVWLFTLNHYINCTTPGTIIGCYTYITNGIYKEVLNSQSIHGPITQTTIQCSLSGIITSTVHDTWYPVCNIYFTDGTILSTTDAYYRATATRIA